jgi:hypothetical protein
MAACCEKPDPRILAKNGRMFCANCKRYLDSPSKKPVLTVLNGGTRDDGPGATGPHDPEVVPSERGGR